MTEVEKLKSVLKLLGRGRNQIAKSLEEKKIQGFTLHGSLCPVAQYLKKKFPGYNVCAEAETISLVNSKSTISVKTPFCVRSFMDYFDSGRYPSLLKTVMVCDPSRIKGAK